jgi:hypothetical protein
MQSHNFAQYPLHELDDLQRQPFGGSGATAYTYLLSSTCTVCRGNGKIGTPALFHNYLVFGIHCNLAYLPITVVMVKLWQNNDRFSALRLHFRRIYQLKVPMSLFGFSVSLLQNLSHKFLRMHGIGRKYGLPFRQLDTKFYEQSTVRIIEAQAVVNYNTVQKIYYRVVYFHNREASIPTSANLFVNLEQILNKIFALCPLTKMV